MLDKWDWLLQIYMNCIQIYFKRELYFDVRMILKYLSKYSFGMKQIENNIALEWIAFENTKL